jgi:N-acetylglucosamine-6-phosphate deacetylase
VDFNSDLLTLSELRLACLRLRQDGVTEVLATIITADVEKMATRLRQIVALREHDTLIGEVIRGLHIEGPFISSEPGYVGAHPPQCVRMADIAVMQRLLDAAGGLARIVTLAPESDPGLRLTELLVQQGVVVSAGHCNPSIDQLRAAIDAGLTMFTHLGNGCPVLLDRHENVIQRVLSMSDRLWITIIADGTHLPFYVLGNFLRSVGFERAIVVTDATAAAGMGPGRYAIGGMPTVVGPDGAPRLCSDDRYLAGSALTMPQAARNLATYLELSEQQIARLCGSNPSAALRR